MAKLSICAASGETRDDATLDDLLALRGPDGRVREPFWADIEAPSPDEMRRIAERFGIHPLTVDDCLTRRVPVKWENFDDYLYLVSHALNFNRGWDLLETVNLSVLIFRDFVLSVHAVPLRGVGLAREKLRREHKGRLPSPDWAWYALLEGITSFYVELSDDVDEEVEALDEAALSEDGGAELLQRMAGARRHLAVLRRRLAPMRESLQTVTAREMPFLRRPTQLYLRDVLDNVVRMLEKIEVTRETLMNAQSNYLAQASNRMNAVMKTLSIVATLMLPLSFLTGLFGMNVPVPGQASEGLAWFGLLVGGMVAVAMALFVFFRLKRWF